MPFEPSLLIRIGSWLVVGRTSLSSELSTKSTTIGVFFVGAVVVVLIVVVVVVHGI